MSETLEGEAPAEPKNSACQRRALRKGEKLPLEGEVPAEPKRVRSSEFFGGSANG